MGWGWLGGVWGGAEPVSWLPWWLCLRAAVPSVGHAVCTCNDLHPPRHVVSRGLSLHWSLVGRGLQKWLLPRGSGCTGVASASPTSFPRHPTLPGALVSREGLGHAPHLSSAVGLRDPGVTVRALTWLVLGRTGSAHAHCWPGPEEDTLSPDPQGWGVCALSEGVSWRPLHPSLLSPSRVGTGSHRPVAYFVPRCLFLRGPVSARRACSLSLGFLFKNLLVWGRRSRCDGSSCGLGGLAEAQVGVESPRGRDPRCPAAS